MKINNKFVYVKNRKTFEDLIQTIPKGLNPIVFIEDTREIWTNNTYFSMNDPDVFITEDSGSVNINIGQNKINLSTFGDSLSIRKGVGEKIIISSTALTKINTEAPLEWDLVNKKLIHQDSEVVAGTYGSTSNQPNASSFTIPYYVVDSKGHLTNSGTSTVQIRDYVEQLKPGNEDIDRNIILSQNKVNDDTETGPVRKANGLTYNDSSKKLKVEGGIDSNGDIIIKEGNLEVKKGVIIGDLQGDISGSAIPKIHLSDDPKFGGASKDVYGHVVLVDEFKGVPVPSSDNKDLTNIGVVASAASPYLVYTEINKVKEEIKKLPNIGEIVTDNGSVEIIEANQKINIKGVNGINISINEQDELIFKGINVSAYRENEMTVKLLDQLNLTTDFEIDDKNNLSLRWTNI